MFTAAPQDIKSSKGQEFLIKMQQAGQSSSFKNHSQLITEQLRQSVAETNQAVSPLKIIGLYKKQWL